MKTLQSCHCTVDCLLFHSFSPFLKQILAPQLHAQLKRRFSFTFSCVLLIQFDATLDVLSSFIVLWRYMNAAAVHSAHREYM